MEQTGQVHTQEPPISEAGLSVMSFPVRAFGYGTSRYRAFLEALVDGLCAYEAAQEGVGHAATPLPAA